MGLHTGEAAEREGNYFGPAVNRAARLMATAHGGQIICSLTTASLADVASVSISSLGEHRLRDLAVPEQVFQLGGGRSLTSAASMLSPRTSRPCARTSSDGPSR